MQFFDLVGLPRQTPAVVGQNDPTQPGGESTLDIQVFRAYCYHDDRCEDTQSSV